NQRAGSPRHSAAPDTLCPPPPSHKAPDIAAHRSPTRCAREDRSAPAKDNTPSGQSAPQLPEPVQDPTPLTKPCRPELPPSPDLPSGPAPHQNISRSTHTMAPAEHKPSATQWKT